MTALPAFVPTRKLGKRAPRYDARTLQLAHYLTPALPPVPPAKSWGTHVARWGMLLNDAEGDCTIAAAGHHILAWTSDSRGQPVLIPDSAIQAAYVAVTAAEGAAYNPATGANDNGCVELDVLNYWRQTGIGGHTIGAYAALEPQNQGHVEAAAYLFGGVYIGLALPLTARSQTGRTWAVVPGAGASAVPGSWGGHAVPVVRYNPQGLTVVTWGALQFMTWQFWRTYCDEAYALLSSDFLKGGRAPNGVDLAGLQADLAAVAT